MENTMANKEKNSKFYCIPSPPLLWFVNENLLIFSLFALLIFAIYFIYIFILKKKRKQKLVDKKIKRKLLFILPLLIYFIAGIFLAESNVFYLICFVLLGLSFVVSISVGIKKKIIKKRLIFKFLIVFFTIISILSVVAFTARIIEKDVFPESIHDDYEGEYRSEGIWFPNVLGCPRRLF